MSARTHTTLHRPRWMTAAARAALADALYATHREVFDGLDRDGFAQYVVESPADDTRILVLRDAEGRPRGYCASHVFDQVHLGRRTLVVRMEIAAEPAFRKQRFAAKFICLEALRLAARYPGVPRYFLACFVHPSAYVSLVRHVSAVWPNPDGPTPPRIEALMHSLDRAFDLKVRDGIARVGWIARGDRRPKTLSREAAFYLERNPGYGRGEGLMTVISFRTPDVVQGVVDCARLCIRRRGEVAAGISAAPGGRSLGSAVRSPAPPPRPPGPAAPAPAL